MMVDFAKTAFWPNNLMKVDSVKTVVNVFVRSSISLYMKSRWFNVTKWWQIWWKQGSAGFQFQMACWFIGCNVVNLNDGRIGENRSHHVSSIGLMTRSFNRLHFLFPITPASPVIVLSSEKFPLKPGKGVPTKDKLANEVDLGFLLIHFIFRCNRLSLQNLKFTLKL